MLPLPRSRRVPSGGLRLPVRLSLLLAPLLSGCISDGPNETGRAYLEDRGVVFGREPLKVVLDSLPVDSLWVTNRAGTEDLRADAEQNLGAGQFVLGRQFGFSSKARLAFEIDSAFLDSAAAPGNLKVSLGLRKYTTGTRHIDSALIRFARENGDSARIRISSFVLSKNRHLPEIRKDLWKDTVRHYFVPLVQQFLPFASPVGRAFTDSAVDTVTFRLDRERGYHDPSTAGQGLPLENLRQALRRDLSARKFIVLELELLLPGTDSAAGPDLLLRFHGNDRGRPPEPFLVTGGSTDAETAGEKKRVGLTAGGTARRGVNYRVDYQGPRLAVLAGKARTVNFSLSRGALLSALSAALQKQNRALEPEGAGKFDLRYFVPFAQLSLPIAKPFLEGELALDFTLNSRLDSVPPGAEDFGSQVSIPVGGRAPVLRFLDIADPGRATDSLALSYTVDSRHPERSRKVAFLYADPDIRDTLVLQVGDSLERKLALRGFRHRVNLRLRAGTDSLGVTLSLVARDGVESNSFAPPEGQSSNLSQSRSRFADSASRALTLRATSGIQRLLNRGAPENELRHTFSLSVFAGVNREDPSRDEYVDYPVFSVVPLAPASDSAGGGSPAPGGASGNYKVGLTLYLYPLRSP